MASNVREFHLHLWDNRIDRPIEDETGSFIVLTQGTAARPTVYEDRFKAVTITNSQGTISDGDIQFYIDDQVTSVDLAVMTASGRAYFLEALTGSQHRVDVYPEERDYLLIIPFDGEASAGAAFDSGMALVAGSIIKDAYVRVLSATGGETLDVGLLATDPDGYLDAASLAALGAVFTPAGVLQPDSLVSTTENVSYTQITTNTANGYIVIKYELLTQ